MTTVTGGKLSQGAYTPYVTTGTARRHPRCPMPDAEPETFPVLLLFSLHPQYSHLYNGVHLLP